MKNAAYRVTFPIIASTTLLPITGATAVAPFVSKDGGTFTATSGSATELATNSGVYYVDILATETNCDQLFFKCTSSSANAVTVIKELIPEAALDSGVAQGGAAGTVTLASTASATNSYYVGAMVEVVRGTGAGQMRAITAYVGSTKIATLDRNWATNPDNTSVYIVRPNVGIPAGTDAVPTVNVTQLVGSATAGTNLKSLYVGGVLAGTISDVGATTTAFKLDSTFSATDNFYNNALVVFTTGTLSGLAGRVLSYTGATKLVTLTTPSTLPSAPANGTGVVILSHQE